MPDVDRTVTFTAERRDSLFLHQQWLSGVGADGVTFELDGGVAAPLLRVTVHHNEYSTSEVIDLRAGIEAWVTRLVTELDSEAP